MTKKARAFETNSSPGCAPSLVTLRWTQRYVVLVLRVVVPGGSSRGRECRGWSCRGWRGGSATPAAAAVAPRLMRASSSIWLRRSRSWHHTSAPPIQPCHRRSQEISTCQSSYSCHKKSQWQEIIPKNRSESY